MTPLTIEYWEAVRLLAKPFELVKFTLIYDGDLSAGKNTRAEYASRLRNEFHDQLADLWDSHVVFRALRNTARTPTIMSLAAPTPPDEPFRLPDFLGPVRPLDSREQDLCAPIPVPNLGSFIPVVRQSLNLGCAVDVLFLRHQEPFKLMQDGGDLDNRIKTLFDALKMPRTRDEHKGELTSDPLYVVMEDDALISDISVKSGRLLGERAQKPFQVKLVIDITVKVLRVMDQNQILLGD